MSTRKLKINDKIQWLVLWCMCLGRYVEPICIILLLILCRRKYSCPHICFFLMVLFVHFIIANLITDYPWSKFIQQFTIVSLMTLGYYQFFHNYVPSIQGLWNKYLKISLWMCYIGYLQYGMFLLLGHDYIGEFVSYQYMTENTARMQGIFIEPGNFAAFITPAVAYCWLNRHEKGMNKKSLYLMTLALLLTFTTIGYFSLFIIFVYIFRKTILKYCWLTIIPLLMFVTYVINFKTADENAGNNKFDAMLMKFSNTYNSLSYIKPEHFELLDLSSYAILSNLWVADNAPCRLIGTGLGTHEVNYKKEYPDTGFHHYGLNSTDAYSLFTRIYSEFGYLGIAFLFVWIIKRFNCKNNINIALAFLLLSLLIRGGHYFQYGVIFFVYCYYYSGKRKLSIASKSKYDFDKRKTKVDAVIRTKTL